MQYMPIIEAPKKWCISQSRIRKLIKENRIEGVPKPNILENDSKLFKVSISCKMKVATLSL